MVDSKLDLLETGTRWQHYIELRDLFALGVVVLDGMSVKSTMDDLKRKKLQAAVEMIESRINILSGFEDGWKWGGPLRKVVEDEVEPMFFDLREKLFHDKENEHSKGDSTHPST